MAVPAYPGTFKIKQADGTEVTVRIKGDEKGNCLVTEDGYALMLNEQTGNYEYATMQAGVACPSGIVATEIADRPLQAKNLLDGFDKAEMVSIAMKANSKGNNIIALADSARKASGKRRTLINNFPHFGEQHSIVILMEFTDKEFSAMDDAQQYYNDAMNKEGFTANNGANGSARDFFIANSNGLFKPTFDVYGPVKINYKQHDAGQGTYNTTVNMGTFVKAAVEGLDSVIDFSQYDHDGDGFVDNIYIYYAGKGAADSYDTQTIWPHAASLYKDWGVSLTTDDGVMIGSYTCSNEVDGTRSGNLPAGIGTFVHEFGHCLGFADHYDTSDNSPADKYTPGDWDTMATGNYNNNSNTPPLYSAFERYELGWLTPEELTHYSDTTNTLEWLGESNKAYKVSVPGKNNEYFLLENRQLKGWDAYLPASGMLVWHIDDNKAIWNANTVNTNANHQYVDIVEANGKPSNATYTKKGVPFPGSSKVTTHTFTSWAGDELISIENIAVTDSVVSFNLVGAGTSLAEPQVTASNVQYNAFDLSWPKVDNADKYILNVKKVGADNTLTALSAYSEKQVTDLTASVEGLEEQTTYQVTVSSCSGSFYSKADTVMVTTCEMPFNMVQMNTVAADPVYDKWFKAQWTALDRAQAYEVTLSKRTYDGAETTTAYDFTDKKAGLPDGWTTNSSYYISTDGYYGAGAPALRLTANGNYLTVANAGGMISSLSFWYCVGKAADGSSLSIQTLRNGEWTTEETVDASATTTANVTYTFTPAKQARILFNRKSNSNVLIDDVSVTGNSIANHPVDRYNEKNVGNVTEYTFTNLEPETEYGLVVRGICNGEKSLSSDEVVLTTLSTTDAISATAVEAAPAARETYDLSGRRMGDKGAKGIYIVRQGGKTTKVVK